MLGCRYPIIGGPMFLVSDAELVVAVSEAGGVGGMPSLNWRKTEEFQAAVRDVKAKTRSPYSVNLIVNKANPRVRPDLDVCVEERVPLVITSLGNPKETIERMHAVGCKVFCDVTTLEYAKKVEGMGADGVIAVSAGAGGHAGPTSPLVLIPYLRRHLRILVVAAGGVANGTQIASAMCLGASAVQIGTRFIATEEAKVDVAYKKAILSAAPEDILMTNKISGTPVAVIKTPYTQKLGTELSLLERYLFKNPRTKKYMKMLRAYLGSEALRKAITGPTFKEIWSAGQGVGLIDDIVPAREVVLRLVNEYYDAVTRLATQAGIDVPAPPAAKLKGASARPNPAQDPR